MELHEYYVKELFRSAGLPVLPGQVAYTPQEAQNVAKKIGQGPFWVKPQVLLGYSPEKKENPLLLRKLSETPEDVLKTSAEILGQSLKGFSANTSATIQRVYIERAVQKKSLCRFVFRVDFDYQTYTLTLVSEKQNKTFYLTDLKLTSDLKKTILKTMKINDTRIGRLLMDVLEKAYQVFLHYGAMAVELNPIVQDDKTLVVVDGRLVFDPDSLFRFPEIVKCQ
jgi:succinyl-CoA synthetase beta subunit